MKWGKGKCCFCGHWIRAKEGYITRYKGKLCHVGCLGQKVRNEAEAEK